MMKRIVLATALAVLPATAFAQSGAMIRDPAGGVTHDPALNTGMFAAPPLTRDPAGGTMIDDSPRFRAYVVQQDIPSYSYRQDIAVGTVLPQRGVVYRQVPAEYGPSGYRYTVVNDQAVVVEPRSRRVVQIIE